MGDHHGHGHDHATLTQDRRILYAVLVLNFSMFLLEVVQGIDADSSSLLADSIDFLSDSFNYAITLYVMHRALPMRANAALIKAYSMIVVAIIVVLQSVHNIIENCLPNHLTMGWVGALALVVNVVCTILLYRSRERDSNMLSVWLCSRNDAIANVLILIAAFFVYLTSSLWPDLIVALVIAGLASTSALKIIASAKKELRNG